jgi:hypothetical protein
MKNTLPLLAAVALLSTLTTGPTAHAGLIGAQVTYEYLFPDPSSITFSLPKQTITPATSLVDTTDFITTTFTDKEIIITNNTPGAFADEFNGPSYLFSGVTITNVTADSASSPAFLGVPSFTSGDIMVNFAGLPNPPSGAQFILDVTSSVVPEPSTWALTALGFGLLGLAGWRSRRRSVAVAA